MVPCFSMAENETFIYLISLVRRIYSSKTSLVGVLFCVKFVNRLICRCQATEPQGAALDSAETKRGLDLADAKGSH